MNGGTERGKTRQMDVRGEGQEGEKKEKKKDRR